MTSEFDLFTMREAIRSVARFLSAPAWAGYILSPAGALADVDLSSDEQLNAYIRNNTGSLFHPVGTSSMSRRGSSSGVVDPDLKVKGIEGVHVVDASVMVSVAMTITLRMHTNVSKATGPCCTYASTDLRDCREGCRFDQGGLGLLLA